MKIQQKVPSPKKIRNRETSLISQANGSKAVSFSGDPNAHSFKG